MEEQASVIQEIENEFSKTNPNEPLVDLQTTYSEPLFTISKEGVKALPQGDLVAISAKAKSGKTFLCSILASAILSGECCGITGLTNTPKLHYYDTEQHIRNSAKLARRIHYLCGWNTSKNNENFKCFSLRTFTSAERMNFIEAKAKEERPQVIVVDGVRDLIEDFNDISQSADCINRLMKLSADLNLLCICVLHQNKAKENSSMRGHLGTELLNKCADVLEVKRTEKVFCVTTTDSRNEPLPDWSFTLNENAIPIIYDGKTTADDARISKIKNAIVFCLSKGTLHYMKLVEQYAIAFGCAQSTAKKHIALALQNGFIYQNENCYCLATN